MFYYLLYPLKDIFFGFNVFRYITFRASGAALTGFILSIFLGKYLIPKLSQLGMYQRIRKQEEHMGLYPLHKQKENTPTMGGLIIIFGIIISTLLWCKLDNIYIFLTLGATLGFGVIGFLDDYLKHIRKKSLGLTMTMKLVLQVVISGLIVFIIYKSDPVGATLKLPFLKHAILNLGTFYMIFAILVIIGSSNAVNLTDGLDGLAIGCVIMVTLTFTILSYITSHIKISNYLNIFFLPQAGEVSIFCASIFGASLGFLWFNSYPAAIFMGDTGALSLGGALGVVAVIIKKEILLFLCGGIFVVEAVSVMLQVISYKIRGRRIFEVAPLHHHFQLKGWPESKVVIRLWIIGVILALITLATLKLR